MTKQQTPYRMTALTDIKPYDRIPAVVPGGNLRHEREWRSNGALFV